MPERTSTLARRTTSSTDSGLGQPVLLQAPQDVLDIHHRVVHQLADGDGQAAQRHHVDRLAQPAGRPAL
jgi:hypothetical protein